MQWASPAARWSRMLQPIILALCAVLGLADGTTREWQVDGVTRTAIVHAPATKPEGGAPVIFVFHGHGGNSRNVERGFALHTLWPEAVVVYPQGLAAKTKLDPEGKQPGWQLSLTDGQDRDLKFFDAMLDSLKKEGWVDPARVYVTGHSNGGAFTYLLSGVRNDVFAAAAPSAGGTGQPSQLKPIPMLILGGRKDKIVPFEGQERMMRFMRRLNKCAEAGTEWAPGATQYASEIGAPVVTFIHDGGHEFSKDGPALMVKFFKEHTRKAAAPAGSAPATKTPAPPETKPGSKPGATPDTKPSTKPDSKPDSKPDTKPAAKPAPAGTP